MEETHNFVFNVLHSLPFEFALMVAVDFVLVLMAVVALVVALVVTVELVVAVVLVLPKAVDVGLLDEGFDCEVVAERIAVDDLCQVLIACGY